MNFNKRTIYLVIIALAVLLNLLAPVFTLMSASASLLGTKLGNSCSGYGALFSGYPAAMEDSAGWASIFTVIQMLVSLILIVVAARAFSGNNDETKVEKTALSTAVTTFVVCLVYMINGFICVSDAQDSLGRYGDASTYAYFPFIIAVLLLGAQIAVTKMKFNGATAKKRGGTSEDQALDTILRYKALLDSGIITPEEFEAKKALILGGVATSAPQQAPVTTSVPETPAPAPTPAPAQEPEEPTYITAVCTQCQARLKAPYEYVGRRVRCSKCQEVFTIQL